MGWFFRGTWECVLPGRKKICIPREAQRSILTSVHGELPGCPGFGLQQVNSRTSPLESRVYKDKKSPLHWVSAPTVSFSDVGRYLVLRGHSRYLGWVWSLLPRNLGLCFVRKEENMNPKRSPEINTYVRAREAPWMSGFWIPAGRTYC